MTQRIPGAELAHLAFVENWPTDESAEALLDELLFQRARSPTCGPFRR